MLAKEMLRDKRRRMFMLNAENSTLEELFWISVFFKFESRRVRTSGPIDSTIPH